MSRAAPYRPSNGNRERGTGRDRDAAPSRKHVAVRLGAGRVWLSPLDRRELAAVLAAMRGACGVAAVVELTLTDDASICAVNERFLGCSGPTNILSFPAPDETASPETRGTMPPAVASLVLSLDTLDREAFLYGQDVTDHTLRLLAHGMAHLVGLDHGERMEAMEDRAFAAGSEALRLFRAGNGGSPVR